MDKQTKIQQVRTEAVAEAISLGLPAGAFKILWDEKPIQSQRKKGDRTRYAIPPEVKKKATAPHLSFWNRHVENSGKNKPKTIKELDARIVDYLSKQSELGYAHLLPEPSIPDLAKRYNVIRDAPIAEAADFPPDWQAIRAVPQRELHYHLENHARRLTAQRCEGLKATADYLLEEMKNGTYKPAEIAEIIAWSSKYKIEFDNHGRPKTVKINPTNEHMPHVFSGKLAALTIEKMRGGNQTNPLPIAEAATQALVQIRNAIVQTRSNETGWVTYAQSGSEQDAERLSQAVAATPWCTGTSTNTAKSHLSGGPFYVYFEDGLPKLAIRTTANRIAEIRGIGSGQKIMEEKHLQIAEEFILSGIGPSGGEDYLHDQNLRRDLAKFGSNGEITTRILKILDQHGQIVPSKAKPKMGAYGQSSFEEEYLAPIRKRNWAENELVEITPEGKKYLKTNFIGQANENPNFHKVAGEVELRPNQNNTTISMLEEAETIVINWQTIKEHNISFPNLQKVGNISCPVSNQCSLSLPKLKEAKKIRVISGSVEAPNLIKLESIIAEKAQFGLLQTAEKIVTETDLNISQLETVKEIKTKGELIAPKLKQADTITTGDALHLDLASLETIGTLSSQAQKITAPKLRTAHKVLSQLAEQIDLTSLETADTIQAFQALEINLPAARTIKNLRAEAALTVLIPNLIQANRIEADSATRLDIGNCQKVQALFAPLVKIEEEEIEIRTNYTKGKTGQKEQQPNKPSWDAKTDGYQIWLNAASVEPGETKGKIHHELAHLALADTDVQNALDELFRSLPIQAQAEILFHNAEKYPYEEQSEERRAKTFEILATKASPKAFDKFIATLIHAWNRITGKESLPPKRETELINLVLERGLEKIKEKTLKMEQPEPEILAF